MVNIYVDKQYRIYAAVQNPKGIAYVVYRSPTTRKDHIVDEIEPSKDWELVQKRLNEYAKQHNLNELPF